MMMIVFLYLFNQSFEVNETKNRNLIVSKPKMKKTNSITQVH